jgi:hypothetical protein
MPEYQLEPSDPDKNLDIDSLTSFECEANYRFIKEHLHLLFKQLKFPDICKLSNGSVMHGENVFLRGLYELVGGELKHKIAHKFGRETC